MNWQKIANIAGPRGADGVDGETPDIEWQGTALSVNGEVGPDLRGPQGTPGDPGKDSTVPGPPGERGAPGPAPAIKIGTVSSGTTPSATITGTSPDLTLGLVLPKGDRGDRGETGAPGVVSSASSYVLVGPGRPDVPSTTAGTITGSEPVGAEYRSTDGAGVGAFVWMKRPGGKWEVTDGDTGGRLLDVRGFETASSKVAYRRVGLDVEISTWRTDHISRTWALSLTTLATVGSVPVGFRPSQPVAAPVTMDDRTDVGGAVVRPPNDQGDLRVKSSLGNWYTFRLSFRTSDPWPATLPGSPS